MSREYFMVATIYMARVMGVLSDTSCGHSCIQYIALLCHALSLVQQRSLPVDVLIIIVFLT